MNLRKNSGRSDLHDMTVAVEQVSAKALLILNGHTRTVKSITGDDDYEVFNSVWVPKSVLEYTDTGKVVGGYMIYEITLNDWALEKWELGDAGI